MAHAGARASTDGDETGGDCSPSLRAEGVFSRGTKSDGPILQVADSEPLIIPEFRRSEKHS